MTNPYQEAVDTQERFTRARRLHGEHRTSGSKFWNELDFHERAPWVFAASLERLHEEAKAQLDEMIQADRKRGIHSVPGPAFREQYVQYNPTNSTALIVGPGGLTEVYMDRDHAEAVAQALGVEFRKSASSG